MDAVRVAKTALHSDARRAEALVDELVELFRLITHDGPQVPSIDLGEAWHARAEEPAPCGQSQPSEP